MQDDEDKKMHDVDDTKDGHVESASIVWPLQTRRRQRLVHAGERQERDPALLPCNGSCSKSQVLWKWHHMVNSASYRCDSCGNTRRWGIGFSFRE